MSDPTRDSSSPTIGALIKIHSIIVLMVAIFAIITLLAGQVGKMPVGDDSFQLKIVIPVMSILTLIGLYVTYFFTRNQLQQASLLPGLPEKLAKYRSIFILRMAGLQGPAIVAILFYYLSASFVFLVFTGVFLMLIIRLKPTRQRIADDLDLKGKEREFILRH